jgi:hypothetical protein
LHALPDAWQAGWSTLFTRGPLLALHRSFNFAGQSGETRALLVEEGRIEVWAPLNSTTRRQLAQRWRRMVERPRVGAGQIDNDNDELVDS